MNSSPEGRIDIRLTRGREGVAGVDIRSSRPRLAQRLMAGRTPEETADLAGLIFSLCGKAQRVAAQAACEAAQGLEPGSEVEIRRAHEVRRELAQEHAWRLLLNWPEQVGRAPDMPSLLKLRQAAAEPAGFAVALEALLATVVLGESADSWLARDLDGFDHWRREGRTQAARLFADLGDGPDAVVDVRLRVHGLSGLRVVDASVMPTVTSGNTNAPTMMIGGRCVEMMLADA